MNRACKDSQLSTRVTQDIIGLDVPTLASVRLEAVKRIWAILAEEADACPRIDGRSIVIENIKGRVLAEITFDDAINSRQLLQ